MEHAMCNQRHFKALEKDFCMYSWSFADLNTPNAQESQLGRLLYNATSCFSHVLPKGLKNHTARSL